jgi:hypothetical protein
VLLELLETLLSLLILPAAAAAAASALRAERHMMDALHDVLRGSCASVHQLTTL